MTTVTGRQRTVILATQRGTLPLVRHWLLGANALNAALVGLSMLAPYLRHVGWDRVAMAISGLYGTLCAQTPTHSFYLYGHPVALCERCLAIYGALLVGGVLFARLRPTVSRLPLLIFFALSLPVGLDGVTQALGWRESTRELRLLTGGLFGLATVWLTYPYLEAGFSEARATVEQRFVRLGIQ